jgi:hypothetical protein
MGRGFHPVLLKELRRELGCVRTGIMGMSDQFSFVSLGFS